MTDLLKHVSIAIAITENIIYNKYSFFLPFHINDPQPYLNDDLVVYVCVCSLFILVCVSVFMFCIMVFYFDCCCCVYISYKSVAYFSFWVSNHEEKFKWLKIIITKINNWMMNHKIEYIYLCNENIRTLDIPQQCSTHIYTIIDTNIRL